MRTYKLSFYQYIFICVSVGLALFFIAGGRLHQTSVPLRSNTDGSSSVTNSLQLFSQPLPVPVQEVILSNIEWPPLLSSPDDSVYPVYTSLFKIVQNWSPDDPELPTNFKETLQHFNYSNPVERGYAEKFRNAEVPFKLYDVPEFAAVAALWTDEYLLENLQGHEQHVEKSENNHFMYWTPRGKPDPDWEAPTEIVKMSFPEWLKIAKEADKIKLQNDTEHYYFMTSSPARDDRQYFVSRDLDLFATSENNFFITNVPANKGIQCRFGMRGIIAEAHFDSGRNMVTMLKGAKRYILNPPSACKSLGIISDQRHPSYRHSVIDWSDIRQAESRGFTKVEGIDTIVKAGEVLYIPSYWLHYIISTRYSIQCNSRSGGPPGGEGQADIEECFGPSFA